jgi:hypothetical protein
MHKGTYTGRRIRIATLAVAIAALSGCAAANKATDWFTGKSAKEEGEPVILGAPDANDYLNELFELAAGDPAKQADIFADAQSAATLTPGPSTELRFGLVLATQGHAESDAQRAESILREVLAQSELLTQAEIALATIHLRSVERLIVIDTEARQMRESTTRAARTQSEAMTQRLNRVETENSRLRAELEDAQQKLEAITTIERSIREQE